MSWPAKAGHPGGRKTLIRRADVRRLDGRVKQGYDRCWLKIRAYPREALSTVAPG
jgi:hypothetical protein